MNQIAKYIKGDKLIWVAVILLSAFSILAVYSSTSTLAYRSQLDSPTPYLFKHLFIIIFGFGIIYIIHRIYYKYFALISKLALLISVPLLLITLITGISTNEASRWLNLPLINISFQTSDFAKLALIMYLAYKLTRTQEYIHNFKKAFLPIIIPIFIICGLILPANFSTAALLFTTSIILIFIGRVNFKHLLLLGGVCIVLLAILLLLIYKYPNIGRFGTWKARIENFFGNSHNPDDTYQVNMSKMAIANANIFLPKPGQSIIKNYFPNVYCDFIYAIIIEEYGFVIGGIGILILYLIIFFSSVNIIRRVKQPYPMFLTIGLTLLLVFQALINMAVTVNLFPVTGQTLPFVSMGGTSIWFTSIAIGMILSVSREVEKSEKRNRLKENATLILSQGEKS